MNPSIGRSRARSAVSPTSALAAALYLCIGGTCPAQGAPPFYPDKTKLLVWREPVGKEPAGLGGNPNLHYALHLAERGYVTLAPDYPSFGAYPFDFKKSGFVSGTMKGIWNHMCAVDLLQSLLEVDGERIGCMGHS